MLGNYFGFLHGGLTDLWISQGFEGLGRNYPLKPKPGLHGPPPFGAGAGAHPFSILHYNALSLTNALQPGPMGRRSVAGRNRER